MTALFDLPAGAQRVADVVASLSAGGRRRVRQAQAVAAGVHPLALAMTGVRMHPDASRDATAADRPDLDLRCGTCWHRRDTGWGYPKCWRDGTARISHGDATTVRAWWPACTDYSPAAAGDSTVAKVHALMLEPVQCRCPHGEDWHAAGGCEARGCPCEVEPR
jgi:hypothetical protein